MGQFYLYETRISAAQAGLCFQCRPSGMLDILQEAATQAACQFHGSGPEMLAKYNGLWMVTRIWYRLDRPLLWNEALTVKTWHRGGKGALLYRDFDLLQDGVPLGEATSIWVLVDAATRKPIRLSTIEELAGTEGGELCKDIKLAGLRLPPDMALAQERQFHYSDTDCNGHVNNTRYADVAADALGLDRLLPQGQFVSSLQVGYLHECLAGDSLRILTGTQEGRHFVQGVDPDGVSRFDAALTLSPLPEKQVP